MNENGFYRDYFCEKGLLQILLQKISERKSNDVKVLGLRCVHMIFSGPSQLDLSKYQMFVPLVMEELLLPKSMNSSQALVPCVAFVFEYLKEIERREVANLHTVLIENFNVESLGTAICRLLKSKTSLVIKYALQLSFLLLETYRVAPNMLFDCNKIVKILSKLLNKTSFEISVFVLWIIERLALQKEFAVGFLADLMFLFKVSESMQSESDICNKALATFYQCLIPVEAEDVINFCVQNLIFLSCVSMLFVCSQSTETIYWVGLILCRFLEVSIVQTTSEKQSKVEAELRNALTRPEVLEKIEAIANEEKPKSVYQTGSERSKIKIIYAEIRGMLDA